MSGADGRTSLLTGQRLPRHQDVAGDVRRLRNVIVPDGGAEGAGASVARRKTRGGFAVEAEEALERKCGSAIKQDLIWQYPVAKMSEKRSCKGTERGDESGKLLFLSCFQLLAKEYLDT